MKWSLTFDLSLEEGQGGLKQERMDDSETFSAWTESIVCKEVQGLRKNWVFMFVEMDYKIHAAAQLSIFEDAYIVCHI